MIDLILSDINDYNNKRHDAFSLENNGIVYHVILNGNMGAIIRCEMELSPTTQVIAYDETYKMWYTYDNANFNYDDLDSLENAIYFANKWIEHFCWEQTIGMASNTEDISVSMKSITEGMRTRVRTTRLVYDIWDEKLPNYDGFKNKIDDFRKLG